MTPGPMGMPVTEHTAARGLTAYEARLVIEYLKARMVPVGPRVESAYHVPPRLRTRKALAT